MARRPKTTPPARNIILFILLALALYLYREGFFNQQPQPLPPPNQPAGVTVTPAVETTASWYEVYFTTPRYPDKPEYHQGSLDERLVDFINTANKTIDLADYD